MRVLLFRNKQWSGAYPHDLCQGAERLVEWLEGNDLIASDHVLMVQDVEVSPCPEDRAAEPERLDAAGRRALLREMGEEFAKQVQPPCPEKDEAEA